MMLISAFILPSSVSNYQITPAGKAVLQAYIQQVLSPNSPIYHAISALTASIFQLLSGSKHGPSPENDQKKEPI
jgi:hypothetical protein